MAASTMRPSRFSKIVPPVMIAATAAAMMLWAAGCSSTSSDNGDHKTSSGSVSGVPAGAREMDAGTRTNEIAFTAPGDGRVYLYDVDQKRVLYDQRLYDGERFALDLPANRATINGRTAYDGGLSPDHHYRLYFNRSDVAASAGDRYDRRDDRTVTHDDRTVTHTDDRDAVLSRSSDRDPVVVTHDDRQRTTSSDHRTFSEIPRDAVLVEEGPGGDISYRASRDGTVYVYDADSDLVVYSGHLHDAERLEVGRDRGTINGKTVFERDMKDRHNYRVYFERD